MGNMHLQLNNRYKCLRLHREPDIMASVQNSFHQDEFSLGYVAKKIR